jgi:hypothetical protein
MKKQDLTALVNQAAQRARASRELDQRELEATTGGFHDPPGLPRRIPVRRIAIDRPPIVNGKFPVYGQSF